MNADSIKEAMLASAFLESEIGKRFFCSRNSFNWFLQIHRAELGEHGAIARLGGRLLIVPSKFEQAMASIARPVV